jgi:hypothetical protein
VRPGAGLTRRDGGASEVLIVLAFHGTRRVSEQRQADQDKALPVNATHFHLIVSKNHSNRPPPHQGVTLSDFLSIDQARDVGRIT